MEWPGEGVNEKGRDDKTDEVLVETDRNYFRPTEVDLLIGDPTKAKTKLGWKSWHGLKDLVKRCSLPISGSGPGAPGCQSHRLTP